MTQGNRFQRRHYQAIAEVIQWFNDEILTPTRFIPRKEAMILKQASQEFSLFMVRLCEMFERDNVNFQRDKFFVAILGSRLNFGVKEE
tara:strand:+ start:13840 stop:14103 length:264 start_codon:yes stop_codon:yes gene_type:complete